MKDNYEFALFVCEQVFCFLCFFFFNDLHIGFYKQEKISYRKAACSDTIIFDKEESYK